MTSYSWGIPALECHPQIGPNTNVICNVHWILAGNNGSHSAAKYGNQRLEYDPNNVVPYANLTKEQVVQWVEAALGTEKIAQLKAEIEELLALQESPTVINTVPPWEQQNTQP